MKRKVMFSKGLVNQLNKKRLHGHIGKMVAAIFKAALTFTNY